MKKLLIAFFVFIALSAKAQYKGGSGDGFAMAESPKYYPVVYYKYIKINNKFLKFGGKYRLKKCYTGLYAEADSKNNIVDDLLNWLVQIKVVEVRREEIPCKDCSKS